MPLAITTEHPRVRKLRQAVFVITEHLAQNFLRVLTDSRCRHGVHNRGTRIPDRQRYVWYPADLRMGDTRYKRAFPCFW